MKAWITLAFLLAASPESPDSHSFHLVRDVQVEPGNEPRACAVLDGTVYAHAAPGLADVRLFAGAVEVPYALTKSDTPTTSDPAKLLNLGSRGKQIVFDLEMPHRPYSRVELDLDEHDFIAVARVFGLQRPGESGTLLGTFDLFDFTTDGLARNTGVSLAESTFPYLRFEITPVGKGHASHEVYPVVVQGAMVPPSRLAQTLYTAVAETSTIEKQGRESVAKFQIPARIPIERVSVDLGDGGPRNFSRPVTIRAKAEGDARAMQEDVGGSIARIDMTQAGEKLHLQTLSVPATVGSNAQASAFVEVAINNGDDQPVDIKDVKLEMRERKICFDAPSAPLQMFYGDADLQSPQYDFGRIFNPASSVRQATLQTEQKNPAYQPPVDHRTITEKYPELLWIALMAVITLLGTIAYRSAKKV
jgi:hypothetical protein